MWIAVDDLAAPCLAPFRQLTQPRGPEAPVVVEGRVALERLLAGGHPIQSVLTTPSAHERLAPLLPDGVQCLVASPTLLRHVVGYGFHHGVLALAARPLYRAPAALRTVVVGERITDPANVGALIRNAHALGADAVWLCPGCGDPFSRRAIRTAMGWCFQLPVRQIPLTQAMAELADMPCVAASCAADATALPQFRWPSRCALLVGNEGDGLGADLLRQAQAHVRIPMVGATDSLNVAAATAVLLHSRMSQDAT